MKTYRNEIDGLRAIAVLSVIFYHAGFQLFSGGYVGVDVFFVISGFLITHILLEEQADASFRYVSFYERRARRILPALLVVLIASSVLAYNYLSPQDLRLFSKNLLGANIFIANIISYQQTNYFDAASEIKPLLHLWSLSIEEQYYLLLPPLLLHCGKRTNKTAIAAILALIFIGVAFSEKTIYTNQRAAFFFLQYRAWELLVGSLAAFMAHRKINVFSAHASQFSLMGFLLIVVPIFTYSNNTSFPGLAACLPTLGTALLLVYTHRPSLTHKLLTLRPLTFIGLISYSLYLWHQPLFAFTRYNSTSSVSSVTMLGLIALTIGLSYLTWLFIEKPFRDKRKFTRKSIIYIIASTTFVLSIGAIYTYKKNGFPGRFDSQYSQAFYPEKVTEERFCKFRPVDNSSKGVKVCYFGDVNSHQTVALIGDSHATALITGLDEEFVAHHIKGARFKVDDCPHQIPGMISGSPDVERIQMSDSCLQNYHVLQKHLSQTTDAIVISVRWAARLSPVQNEIEHFYFDNAEGGLEIKPDVFNFAKDESGNWKTDGQAKRFAVSNFIQLFTSTQKQVLLVYPIPEVGWDLPRYNFVSYLTSGKVLPEVSTLYTSFYARNRFPIQTLDGIDAKNISRVMPEKIFCNSYISQRCIAQKDYVPYYHDTNHLSLEGSKLVAREIYKSLNVKVEK